MTGTPRAYSVVLDWLEDQLRSGDIVVGDKLPGERALAEQFGISRASVREATRILDAMGLVRSGVGSGPNAGAIVISEPSAALAWALRMHVATQALPVADLVNTRVLLETQAARTPSPEHVDRAEILRQAGELLDQMDHPGIPTAEFHALDAQFHILLTSLAGNVVVETMMGSLREATVGYLREKVATLDDWASIRRDLQEQHRAILAATEADDGERAATLLRAHITEFPELGS
ncbi:MAG: FCD domain-containing protein [Corynebacterium sp.]|uniref:FadR/GntR family transcriptional regulator n=1 Tax=Corynebacterium sp. TaxID=1720 RepID=UPI0026E01A60|nr:FCD domain-containing protein [Corynebacterium sp.]MDO5670230.1 FCD domain-containing protein [Corynebacterium sp.]